MVSVPCLEVVFCYGAFIIYLEGGAMMILRGVTPFLLLLFRGGLCKSSNEYDIENRGGQPFFS